MTFEPQDLEITILRFLHDELVGEDREALEQYLSANGDANETYLSMRALHLALTEPPPNVEPSAEVIQVILAAGREAAERFAQPSLWDRLFAFSYGPQFAAASAAVLVFVTAAILARPTFGPDGDAGPPTHVAPVPLVGQPDAAPPPTHVASAPPVALERFELAMLPVQMVRRPVTLSGAGGALQRAAYEAFMAGWVSPESETPEVSFRLERPSAPGPEAQARTDYDLQAVRVPRGPRDSNRPGTLATPREFPDAARRRTLAAAMKKLQVARKLHEQGQFSSAMTSYREVIGLVGFDHPLAVLAWYEQGRMAQQASDCVGAIWPYEDILRLALWFPLRGDVLIRQAQCLEAVQEFEHAYARYAHYVKENHPEDARVTEGLARTRPTSTE